MKRVVLSEPGDTLLALDRAVLFYRSSDHLSIYATSHQARIVDGRPVLLSGTPLTLDQLSDVAQLAAERTSYSGFVHPRAVYIGPNTVAWWAPACRRRVWFRHDGEIGERTGETTHPPLLFIARRGKWSVFALRKNERPRPDTRLAIAPYFNVWEGGEICTGNVDLPERINSDSIDAFDDAFFRSRFTHPNQPRLIHRRGGAVRLWLDLLDAELTVADAISKYTRKD